MKAVGSLKIDMEIMYLEVFHNNERLLIVNGKKNERNLIFILNVEA